MENENVNYDSIFLRVLLSKKAESINALDAMWERYKSLPFGEEADKMFITLNELEDYDDALTVVINMNIKEVPVA